jgi:predicted AlkP superfamily pyrophosphatase or phosphodiesterase
MFGNGKEPRETSRTKGNHGFWPTRPDYHSIFLLSGPGIEPGKLGTLEMVSLKDRLANALGVSCPTP